MSDKIGKYFWVKTETGREIAFKRDSGLWELHGVDCLEDCKEAILEVYGEVANGVTTGAEQCNLPFVINWVAIKDQLPPDESKRYMVLRDSEVEFEKWIHNGTEGFWWDYMGITHWMQIPEPPCL